MGRPKQFIDLLGVPALLRSLRAFESARSVDRIYAVGDRGRVRDLAASAGITKYVGCAPPGESRSASTKNGLALLEDESPETLVLVHDGARCLLSPDLVGRIVEAALAAPKAGGVIPAVPVSDTIKVAEGGAVVETLDRSRLHAVQTPQAFRLEALREAYSCSPEALHAATDDASLVEGIGDVLVVAGEKTNIKLTTPEDLILAEAILKTRAPGKMGVRS